MTGPAAGVVRRGAYAVAAVAGVALVDVANVARPATLCPLRAITGVPCPFCGTTTAAVRVAAGDLLGALAANPFTMLALVALVLAPLSARRLPRNAVVPVFTVAVAAAWAWQLARFDVVT